MAGCRASRNDSATRAGLPRCRLHAYTDEVSYWNTSIHVCTRVPRARTHTHTHVDDTCIGDEVSYPRRKRKAAQEIRARPLYSVMEGMPLHPLQHLHGSTVIGNHLFDVIAGGCQLEQLPHDSLLHLCVCATCFNRDSEVQQRIA